MIWYPPVGSGALRNLRELIVQYFSATLPAKLVSNLRMDGCCRKATCVPWRRGVRDYFAADSLDFLQRRSSGIGRRQIRRPKPVANFASPFRLVELARLEAGALAGQKERQAVRDQTVPIPVEDHLRLLSS